MSNLNVKYCASLLAYRCSIDAPIAATLGSNAYKLTLYYVLSRSPRKQEPSETSAIADYLVVCCTGQA